ncbi:glycosyltransferase [Spirosoma utsteinense]|uniref:Glycosyltransferase involved in cell wall biosynthesis n=1 Tax=Spirosoma utsteinense TaxID=2585773 RepID=A0ABR6WC74_9BACT|nr:glycosyltransferase [Spirosoma utsteinense]MBC3788217.1 glycosyltransferase involved in cell wall biosynthesis [Spirosoma utsteinense]MBC3794178.1 glycosyltransferase involved in cell wall biosynthesis [Spirosoma utsteinense]
MKQFDSIICIAQTPWKGDFQKAAVQLMTALSVRHRVLFVDYMYTLKDLAEGLAGRKDVPVKALLHLTSSLTSIPTQPGGELYVWMPPVMMPFNWLQAKAHDQLLPQNTNRLAGGLRAVMKRLAMQRPLVVNAFNPVVGLPLLGRLNECATIYYCFDEITTAGDWMSRHGQRYETDFLQRVDAVVTTSETLRQDKSALQPHTFCVKNGVNFDLFNQARQLAKRMPPIKQVVGYLGTADNRVDLDIMEYCARTMPEVEFQFIGEVHEPQLTYRLGVLPNVTFIPPRQPADLPPLLAGLSVGIIPFVCNRHTYTIYPLKINEYLAAGLPVVSTPFSILDEFRDIIELADTPERFAQALQRALADKDSQRLQQRVDMAQRNTWEQRALEFEAVIEQVPNAWKQDQPV